MRLAILIGLVLLFSARTVRGFKEKSFQKKLGFSDVVSSEKKLFSSFKGTA